MSIKKLSFFRPLQLSVLGVSFIALTACSDFGPYPLATGYKYQQQEYKSADGPEPVLEKYTSRNPEKRTVVNIDENGYGTIQDDGSAMMAQNTNQHTSMAHDHNDWKIAADELVTRMVQTLGLPAEPVYIDMANHAAPHDMSFVIALKEAMRQNNVPMADRSAGAPFKMDFSINDLGMGDGNRKLVTINLISAGEIIDEQSGIYSIGHALPRAVPDDVHKIHGAGGAPIGLTP